MTKEIAIRRKDLMSKIEKGGPKVPEKTDASKAEKFKTMVLICTIFRMSIEYHWKN